MKKQPYGTPAPKRYTKTIPKDLKSEDIGSDVRIVEIAKTEDPSELDILEKNFENVFFTRYRRINPFWISRSTERMCRSLRHKYNAYRNESTHEMEAETAQIIKVPQSQEKIIRNALEKNSKMFEEFIVSTILPAAIALSSSLERSLQTAKVVTLDEELVFDDKFIRMAHSDSLVLQSIEFFLQNSGVSDSIREFYLQNFILHKFGSNKSSAEKSIDLVLNTLLKGQRTSEQAHSVNKTLANNMQKLVQSLGNNK